MGSRKHVSEAEFAGLIEDVLRRLARDPEAAHLWSWNSRPGCDDEPAGLARRNHLRSLLGLLGIAALPGLVLGCDESTPGTADASHDGPGLDGHGRDVTGSLDGSKPRDGSSYKDGQVCGDDPCAAPKDFGRDVTQIPDGHLKKDLKNCADDPCACADDPCACADDPCAAPRDLGVRRDFKICADDPCAAPRDWGVKKDFKICADDPCACADDPC